MVDCVTLDLKASTAEKKLNREQMNHLSQILNSKIYSKYIIAKHFLVSDWMELVILIILSIRYRELNGWVTLVRLQ